MQRRQVSRSVDKNQGPYECNRPYLQNGRGPYRQTKMGAWHPHLSPVLHILKHIFPLAHPTADTLSGKGVPEVINSGPGSVKLGQASHLKTSPKRFHCPNLRISAHSVISREEKRAIWVNSCNLFRISPHQLEQIISHNHGSVFMSFGFLNIKHTPYQVHILIAKQSGFGGAQTTAVEQPVKDRHYKMSGRCILMRNEMICTIEKRCNFCNCKNVWHISGAFRRHRDRD